MASPNVQESDDQAAWGWAEMQRLFEQIEALPDHISIPIEPESDFAIDKRIQDYDPSNDQVVFLIGVALDHLSTFMRILRDPEGGLPTFAGYTLLRAAIEAAGTAYWLRMPGQSNPRIARSLWLIVHARDEATGLAQRLGIENPEGYKRMRARVDAIIASRKGLFPTLLDRVYKKTTILNEVDKHVPRNVFSCLEAWQASSGITHSNRSSALMFLEHQAVEDGLQKMTASATVTALILDRAVSCVQAASDKYVADCRSPRSQ